MKKGFTLIELLAVVVILALIFLFISPRLVSIIKKGENDEKKIIEERIKIAAKDYVNNKASIYKSLIKEGDSVKIYENDLLEAELVDNSDFEKLDNFSYVLVKLSSNDKLIYTIIYD